MREAKQSRTLPVLSADTPIEEPIPVFTEAERTGWDEVMEDENEGEESDLYVGPIRISGRWSRAGELEDP